MTNRIMVVFSGLEIIDFHTHVYPDSLAARATSGICDFYGLKSEQKGTVDALLEKGREAGISYHVLLPVALKPNQARRVNEFIVETCKKHREFIGLGSVHADQDNIPEELDYIDKNGLIGVKMHPDTQRFNIDDRRLYPLYESYRNKGLIVFHCGDFRYDYSHPQRVRRVLDDHPGLRVVAAHLGGWSVFEEGVGLLKDTECMFDISSCISTLDPETLVRYVNEYGYDRVLFGTDYPLWDPLTEVRKFLSLDISDDAKERIAGKNARALLSLCGVEI